MRTTLHFLSQHSFVLVFVVFFEAKWGANLGAIRTLAVGAPADWGTSRGVRRLAAWVPIPSGKMSRDGTQITTLFAFTYFYYTAPPQTPNFWKMGLPELRTVTRAALPPKIDTGLS